MFKILKYFWPNFALIYRENWYYAALPGLPMESVDLTANDRRVIDLVRLILAKESVKKPIKREDFSDFIANFTDKDLRKRAMELANAHLKEHFGMEFVNLPVVASQPSASTTSASRRQAVNKTTAANAAQSFVLVSVLEPEHRALMPVSPKFDNYSAITFIILMIVWLNADRIEQLSLTHQLVECGVYGVNRPLTESNLEAFLEELKNQRLLVKSRRHDGLSVYSWGPRAHLEFPPERMADIVMEMTSDQQTNTRKLHENVTKIFSAQ